MALMSPMRCKLERNMDTHEYLITSVIPAIICEHEALFERPKLLCR